MKKWRKQLAESLKSNVAQNCIARLNREEEDFRYMAAISANDKTLRKQDMAGYLFARLCDRRPKVKWIDEVRMTKKQEKAIEAMWDEGATIWCGVENELSGGTAILLKLDATWIVLYEDGSAKKGPMPMLMYQFPTKLSKPKTGLSAKPVFNAVGGMTLNRYNKAA